MSEKEIIIFEKETNYELKGTKYIVISHFDDNGENMLDKMVRLLKSDIQNISIQNFVE